MTYDTREIRVFLSSTFKDMQAERDYLLKFVFPEVREHCAERGVGFTEIDLRWGVTEEEAKNGTTVAICLSEIDRCRGYPPFFIGFLGERYGWVPNREDLANHLGRSELQEYQLEIEKALESRISVTELEFQYALKGHQELRAEAFFYLRSPDLTRVFYEHSGAGRQNDFYDPADGKLAALKRELRHSPLLAIDNYLSVEEFGESVKAHLLAELERRAPELEDPISRLRRPHLNFARSRTNNYVPLNAAVDAVEKYVHTRLDGREERLYLIQGESGLGKSALMAHLASHFRATITDAVVIDCYIGANGEHSIQQWADDLVALLSDSTEENAASSDMALSSNRWDTLSKVLTKSRCRQDGKPLVLLLDAVNQLSEPAEAVEHLQNLSLPEGVVLILSGTPELHLSQNRVLVNVLARPTREQASAIIERYMRSYRKGLNSELVERLLSSEAANLPLYLGLILEYLRVRASHESLDQDLEMLLKSSSIKELFLTALRGWDDDFSDVEHPALACRAAGYLAASRAGLNEEELGTLLAAETDPVDLHSGKPRLPRIKLSRLLAALRPYLMRNDGREKLMHVILAEAALDANPIIEQRLQIVAACADNRGWHVTERIYQFLHLTADQSHGDNSSSELYRLLSQPSNILDCHQFDRGLLAQALEKLRKSANSQVDAMPTISQTWVRHSFVSGSPNACSQVGEWLRIEGFFREAVDWCLMTLAKMDSRSSGADPHTPALNVMLAAAYMELGEYRVASSILEQVLAILQADDKDLFRFVVLSNLGGCYVELHDLPLAWSRHHESLALLRSAIAEGHERERINLTAPLNNLGDLLRRQCESAQIELWSLQSNQSEEFEIQKAEDQLQFALSQLGDAVAYFKEAIDIETTYFPAGSQSLATTMNNLAQVLRMQNKPDESISLLLEAGEMEQRLLRRDHPSRARTQVNLGLLYQDQDLLAEAAAAFADALTIYRVCEDGSQGGMRTALAELATIRKQQGASEQELAELWEELGRSYFSGNTIEAVAAETAFMKALELRRMMNDKDNSKIARTMYLIGKALFYQQKLRMSDIGNPGAENVITAAMNEFPDNHPDKAKFVTACQRMLVDILLRVASQYRAEGDEHSASDVARQCESYIKALERSASPS